MFVSGFVNSADNLGGTELNCTAKLSFFNKYYPDFDLFADK